MNPMRIEDDPRILEIEEGRVLNLGRGLGGRVIRCLSGSLWITQENDSRDHLLQPGDDWVLGDAGTVVLQAFGTARAAILRKPGGHDGDPFEHASRNRAA